MLKIIHLPITWPDAEGKEWADVHKKGISEIEQLLNNGYSHLSTVVVATPKTTYIVYTLYRHPSEDRSL